MSSNATSAQLNIAQTAWWTLATIIGAGASFFITGLPAALASVNTGLLLLSVMGLIGLIGGAIAGLIAGLMQYATLRTHVPWAGRWIWASVAGWAVGLATLYLVLAIYQMAFFEYPKKGVSEIIFLLLSAVALILTAGAMGAIQAKLLHFMPRTVELWAGTTILGWTLGGAIWLAALYLSRWLWSVSADAFNWFLLPVMAIIAGIVTARGIGCVLPITDRPAHTHVE